MTCDDIAQHNDGSMGDDRALSPQAMHNIGEFVTPIVRKLSSLSQFHDHHVMGYDVCCCRWFSGKGGEVVQ